LWNFSRNGKKVDDNGKLRTLRILNGDETRIGKFLTRSNDKPDYGGFPIAVTMPAKTCIAEVGVYYVIEEDEDRENPLEINFNLLPRRLAS
jgi:hypothetical protein